MPWTMDATVITVATPITTPRIVSAERSLLALMAPSAIATPSITLGTCSRTGYLFGPEGVDRVQSRRTGGGIHAEEHTGTGPQRQGGNNRPEGHPRRQRADACHQRRHAPPDSHSEHATDRGEHHGLDQELPPDIRSRGAHRFPDTNLVYPLIDGHQHDIHDDDSTDHNADADNGRD